MKITPGRQTNWKPKEILFDFRFDLFHVKHNFQLNEGGL